MTRFELIKKLEELAEKISWDLDWSATDYARGACVYPHTICY